MRGLCAAILLATACLVLPAAGSARTDVAAAASGLERLSVPKELRVVSYFPADAGWTRMWEPWRPGRLADDLRRLRSLNANTVRIVVSPPFFGYPEPEPEYLDRLNQFVSIAAAERLHVQLTLFDWWGEYDDVAGSKRWAGTLLAPYVGDPRVAFVELRNEINTADAAALAWARQLIPWLRAFLRWQTPVTLSVGASDSVGDLRALAAALRGAARPDFFDAHYFTGGGERAVDVFRALRSAAAPTPVWVGEVGYPTSKTVSGYAGMALTSSAQEAAQAHYLRLCFEAARRLGLPPPGVWILDDFAPDAIPSSDVSPREPEYTFGLFHVDRSAKPAALTLTRLFSGVRDLWFNGGFEQPAQTAERTTVPAVWSVLPARNLAIQRDGSRAHSGAASVRFESMGRDAGTGRLTIEPVDGAVRAGLRAEVTAWASGSRASGQLRLGIEWFDGELRRVGRSAARVRLQLGGSWTRTSVRTRPPVAAVFARVVIEAADLRGAVWVDGVAFSWR